MIPSTAFSFRFGLAGPLIVDPMAGGPTTRIFTPTHIEGLRSPNEKVGGLVHFGRMLDKIRLHRAGKLPPAWVEAMGLATGLDGACCDFLGVDYPALKERVLAEPDAGDEAVLEWACAQGRRPAAREIRLWNECLAKRGWRDPSSDRLRLRLRAAGLPDDAAATFFELIDLEEGRLPAPELPSTALHVVRKGEGKARQSFDVAFDLLAVGPESMMTVMHYKVGNRVPFHAHPNEQIGYILSGRVRVFTRASESELGAGDSYAIPAGIEHSIEIVTDAEELQVFTPPRPEFR